MAPDAPIVVIGAGPSGLAVAGALAQRGLRAQVLERAPNVGASWRGHYRRLHLHTDGALSTLPGLPAPTDWPTYPSRDAIVAYLEAYASTFDVKPVFGATVSGISRLTEGARLRVALKDGDPLDAAHVVVATGYNHTPRRPSWPGLDTFPGPVLHSREFADGAPFHGQRVLVVGAGNSAGEIAIDLWEHGAAAVSMAIRGPVHAVPRDLFGVPAQRVTVALRHLPARIADRLSAPARRALIGDLRPWGIEAPALGPLEGIEREGRVPLVDVGTVQLIRQGAITVMPGITRIEAETVVFADGRRDRFDAIVLGTGYRSALGELLPEIPGLLDERGLPTVHGAESPALPGLWFCGFRNPTTGALRESAIEATRIADAIAKGVSA